MVKKVFVTVIILVAYLLTPCVDKSNVKDWFALLDNDRNMFCQNPIDSLTGRNYVREPVYRALKDAAGGLSKYGFGVGVPYLDASRCGGGKLLGHISHRKGVDVDIVFLVENLRESMFQTVPHLFRWRIWWATA